MLSVTTKHPLDQLIEGVKRANDWSDPDLVKNAKEQNRVLSKSNISRMRGDLVSIKADVIYALAAGLRVSPAQVAIAAVESMGIALPRYESPTPEQAVRMDVSMSAKDKTLVLGLLKQMRAETAGASGQAGQIEEAKLPGDPDGGDRRSTTADDFRPRPGDAVKSGEDDIALG